MSKATVTITALAVVGLLAGGIYYFTGTKEAHCVAKAEESALASTEVLQVSMIDRWKSFKTIDELKKDSTYILVVDYVERKPAQQGLGEASFQVKEVIKGDKSLAGTNILVPETGGILDGKQYGDASDELFQSGKYLLFLDKFDEPNVKPYVTYFVRGLFAGKFKLNCSVKGYGNDPVRKQAEKMTESDFLKKVRRNL